MSEFLSTCPQCHKKILCNTMYVGARVSCPHCVQEIEIPEPPLENRPARPQLIPTSPVPAAGRGGRRKMSWPVVVMLEISLVSVIAAAGVWFVSRNSPSVAAPARAPAQVLSEGKTVYASSFEAGNFPRNANDGNADTRWAAVDDTFPQWWVVDLRGNYKLSQVVIDWYKATPRCYGYKIDMSLDNIGYNTVVSKLDNTVYGTTTDNISATARYVRIMVIRCNQPGKYASINEVRIYGY